MALIQCPKCGKNTSDTNEKCFHCGFNLLSQTEEPVNLQQYNKLSVAEQEQLRKEYYSLNPKYESYMKKRDRFVLKINATAVITAICWLLYFGLLIGTRIYRAVKGSSVKWLAPVAITCAVVLLVSAVINIVLRKVIYKKYRRNDLIIEKKFQKWLKEEKQVGYIVSFTTKQRKDKEFFDKINVQKKDIEV